MYQQHHNRASSSRSSTIICVMIAIVVSVFFGVLWASANVKLAETQQELEAVRAELASNQMTLDATVDELYRLRTAPVRAVFVYDPAETIYRPADTNSPNAVKLVWFLGKVENLISTNGDIVAPLSLLGYTCIYPDGRNVGGDYLVLLEAVERQAAQNDELLVAVDASGFVDR